MSYKKSLQSPTIASNQKTLPPVNLRERLGKLTEAVNELRTNVEHEAYQQESLEKLSTKNYTILNTQIKALRKAFNTLADVVMEELDSIKTDIYKEFQDTTTFQNKRIDDMTNAMYKVQNGNQEQKMQNIALEQLFAYSERFQNVKMNREMRDRIRALEQKQEEHAQFVQTLIDNSKEDNKLIFEKLKNVVNSNTNQIQMLTNEIEKFQNQLPEFKSKTTNNSNAITDLSRRMIETEENIKVTYQDLANKIQDVKASQGSFRENVKSDTQNILRSQTDLTKKIDELSLKLNERLDSVELLNRQKFYDFEHVLTQVQNEFQDSIRDLARIHKDSSNQMIIDFEKAITSCNNEAKILFKKFNLLENALSKYREEFSLMLTDHEHAVSKKNEQFNKAIFDICRQLSISNPLIY